MPAGQIDGVARGQAVRQVALRELREETGYELAADGDLISLGILFSSPGFTDEHCYFFLARPVAKPPAVLSTTGWGDDRRLSRV